MNDETYTMSLKKSTETVDDVEAEVTKYYFGDKLADETEFKALFQLMISLSTERDLPKEYVETSKAPYMTITYHLITDNNKTVTIKYLPYDESYYAVNTNGIEYFLTDNRKVNEIADAIVKFKK